MLYEKWWVPGHPDRRNVTDPALRFIPLTQKEYDERVVSPSGKILTDKRWFIWFIKPSAQAHQMFRDNLENMAIDFNGTIQFAFVSGMRSENEMLRLSYEAYDLPMPFLIDPEENAAFLYD